MMRLRRQNNDAGAYAFWAVVFVFVAVQHIYTLPNARGAELLSIVRAVASGSNTPANTTHIEHLLSVGANTGVMDEHNKTALHYAASTDGYKAIKELLEAGADRHISDANNRKPLHIAKMHGFGDSEAQLEDSKSRLAALDD